MFDNNGFYYTKNISKDLYRLDLGGSLDLSLENKEYVIFHKRKFKKIPLNNIQNSMQIVTKPTEKEFAFDEKFFIYGLTYYQRQGKQAFLKGGLLEELEIYQNLFNSFNLKLKLREYLEIRGNYKSIDEILDDFQNLNFNEASSFLLGLCCVYGDRNLVEKQDDVYLGNILLKFPFDGKISEYQQIIINMEDALMQANIYNNINYTKKGDFLINIKDNDILKMFGKAIFETKLKDFFQTDDILESFFDKQKTILQKQLNQDLRIELDDFKLTEVKSVKLDF